VPPDVVDGGCGADRRLPGRGAPGLRRSDGGAAGHRRRRAGRGGSGAAPPRRRHLADRLKAQNLALRFALELCAFAALGFWGWDAGHSTAVRIVLAAAAPLAAIV